MMTHARIRLADSTVLSAGDLPVALLGLATASLVDLSWTDPALGYRGQGFWPVTVQVPTFDVRKRKPRDAYSYGVDSRQRRVTAVQQLVDLTAEEIAALPPLPVPEPAILGKGEFYDLVRASGVTFAQIKAASDDPALAEFWFALNNFYSQIRRDHPSTRQGIGAMVKLGHIDQAAADKVFATWPVL